MNPQPALIGIIGGSGLTNLDLLSETRNEPCGTRFGEPSGPLTRGNLNAVPCLFLPRHGSGHDIPPHLVNYRANISALHGAGATHLVAIATVGSMNPAMPPRSLVLPDQLLDYTWGREQTFFTGHAAGVTHVDFTHPFDARLRQQALDAAKTAGIHLWETGCYATTQGPRLETAAEIDRLHRDGADLVGMTAMPEAALARELGLPYVLIAMVVNWAAGRGEAGIHDQVRENLAVTLDQVMRLLPVLLVDIHCTG